MKTTFRVYFVILISLVYCNCMAVNPNNVYIRVNQLGFFPGDIKTAVVFSEMPLFNKDFSVKESSGKTVMEGEISDSLHSYDKFEHCYVIDFSSVKRTGSYFLEVDGKKSSSFKINSDIYTSVIDSLLLFFSVQRCGPTNPYLHKVCHLYDVASVDGEPGLGVVDVTGGWHDAGDYVKFLSTTAYATYMMLFAYEFNKDKLEFDNNKNGAPDILEEARVGIDWLLRCNFSKGRLITQVQDLTDHEVGWRLPENDTLRYQRTGYTGIGKNQVGLYAAVMALASRIWSARFYDYEFAWKLLTSAEQLYSIRNSIPDVDVSQSGFYQDAHFWGKLALGAIELYMTKKDDAYLKDAMTYADSAGSDFWWSWGNINALADYRIAKIDSRYSTYIKNNLDSFNEYKNKSVFREGLPYSWGTTNSLLGVSLQAILYKDITNSQVYDTLAINQIDYILGKNPWGLSFIYNIGHVYPRKLHSQLAKFNNGYLPGAITAGPAPVSVLKQYNIKTEDNRYDYFNTDSVKYFDDWANFITNEPTIVSNATGLFVFSQYTGRGK